MHTLHLVLLAADPGSGTSDSGTGNPVIDKAIPFLNIGVIAFLLFAFLKNWGVVPKWTYDALKREQEQEVARLDEVHQRELGLKDAQIAQLLADKSELKATNDELAKVAQEQFLPALIEANRLTALYVDTLARRAGGQSP